MFEAVGFRVTVTVSPAAPLSLEHPGDAPAGAERRPSRLTDLLDPSGFDDQGLAGELAAVRRGKAQLAAYEAAVVAELTSRRPDDADLTDEQPGHAGEGWVPDRVPTGVSEFLPDELALLVGCSRAAAVGLAERSVAMVREVPGVWEALADGRIDEPRARAIVSVLRGQSVGAGGPVAAAVIAEVAARAVERAAAGELPALLRERTAAALLEVDAAAADRRRKRAERNADVTVRATRDGMTELVTDLTAPVASACREVTDTYARMLKADGDPRPIGQLRALVLADLILRPWDASRKAITAHLTVFAPLGGLRPCPAGGGAQPPDGGAEPAESSGPGCRDGAPMTAGAGPTASSETGWVDGQPITAAQLRQLLAELDALCPGGLQAPSGGSLDISLVDPRTGALRATVTRTELERLARRGCPEPPAHHAAAEEPCGCSVLDRPSPVDRYEPTPAQRRFVHARDHTCRHPGCRRRAGRTDIDHVIPHDDGGPTDCTNLCCLCRRHHRIKTHAPGWSYRMSPDGGLEVTTPSGVTRSTRPPGLGLPDDLLLTPIMAGHGSPADDPPPF
ncbi:hypothetical protein SAMN05661080_02607 [Modestobacter sp. DSM 44400]|uniref:HNH endonuclease signature motif containing protein n=1 Tax=Modestobacter sp. DSM 44400 TaxID=1550230 RepID=UPI000894C90A|nr:HNH endonuclease signature motif containing protein [Modestobacter sp. DSM 44400]SDY18303.1 hypothetical protein SAMN05661080_02607 [Modestobacter sp. DSM 44400]